jgi:hypothetical protein
MTCTPRPARRLLLRLDPRPVPHPDPSLPPSHPPLSTAERAVWRAAAWVSTCVCASLTVIGTVRAREARPAPAARQMASPVTAAAPAAAADSVRSAAARPAARHTCG